MTVSSLLPSTPTRMHQSFFLLIIQSRLFSTMANSTVAKGKEVVDDLMIGLLPPGWRRKRRRHHCRFRCWLLCCGRIAPYVASTMSWWVQLKGWAYQSCEVYWPGHRRRCRTWSPPVSSLPVPGTPNPVANKNYDRNVGPNLPHDPRLFFQRNSCSDARAYFNNKIGQINADKSFLISTQNILIKND